MYAVRKANIGVDVMRFNCAVLLNSNKSPGLNKYLCRLKIE